MSHLITSSGKGAPLTPAEADGNLNLLETRTGDGWLDIVSEFYTRDGPGSPGVSQFIGRSYLPEFPHEGGEVNAFANFHIPHAYRRETMIYPHIHFSVASNASGVIRWGVEWTFARRHDSNAHQRFNWPVVNYIEFAVPENSGFFNDEPPIHFVAEAPQNFGIPGDRIEVDGMVICTVFRDVGHPNDTFPGHAWAITADVHIEVDRHATPNRAPDFYS